MNIEIENFIETYPFIDNPEFNQLIYNKKEFRDEQLSEYPETKDEKAPGILLKHQIIVSRFLSSYTPYDEIYLWHSTGTGKSIAMLSTVEAIFSQTDFYKRAIILTTGDIQTRNLIDNLFNKFSNKYTFSKRDRDNRPYTQQELFRNKLNMISNQYVFETYRKFGADIENQSEDQLRTKYSNRIFVIDEVHNLLNSKYYDAYHRLFHSTQDRKIILLSATPMINKIDDFGKLMNLILPESINVTSSIQLEDPITLGNIVKGRVSYLRSKLEKVVVVDQGNDLIDGKLKVMASKFEENSVQQQIYSTIATDLESKDPERVGESFYNSARDASLFVFPDGSFGKEGFEKYVVGRKFNKQFFDDCAQVGHPMTTKENVLKNLRYYSCKYATVIKTILSKPNRNTFVFSESVKGSGLIVFGLLLKLVGVSYNLIYGSMDPNPTRSAQIKKTIINRFNSENNSQAQNVQVLLGSLAVSEGLSFKNVQEIHILTPHWNMSRIDQAIGRGIRYRSHQALLKTMPLVTVNVYLHVALLPDGFSIDKYLYQLAVQKDIVAKQIEYVVKRNAFDCALTINRNQQPTNLNYSRSCEYRLCNYTCEGIVNANAPVDWSTYNIYYSKVDLTDIKNNVIEIFHQNIRMLLSNVVDILAEQYSPFLVIEGIVSIIETHQPIVNKYGIVNYLKEHNGILFLTSQPLFTGDNMDAYYTQNMTINTSETFNDLVNTIAIDGFKQQLSTIAKTPFELQIEQIKRFSMDQTECIIENAIVNTYVNNTPPNRITQWVLDFYSAYITQYENKWISTYYDPSQIYEQGTWIDASEKIQEELKEQVNNHEQTLIDSGKKYYGIIDREGTFKIRDLRPKAKCSDKKKFQLVEIFYTLGLDPVEEIDINLKTAKKLISKGIFTSEFKKSLSSDQILKLGYWFSKSTGELCRYLKSYFQSAPDNNIYQGFVDENGELFIIDLQGKRNTGKACSSYKRYELLLVLLDFDVPAENNYSQNRETNISNIRRKDKELSEAFLETLTDEQLNNLGYWAQTKSAKVKMCNQLVTVLENTKINGYSFLIKE
jgi:superfamily II DNA or RNA helicase